MQAIVVGFDGSATAQSALEAAVELVDDDGVVHVVTAYRMPSPREMDRVWAFVPEASRSSYDINAAPRAILRTGEAYLTERSVDHERHFVNARPANAILKVADDVRADLIIVGSRGLAHGTRFIRSSVSSRVANHARTSLMIVHDNGDDLSLDGPDGQVAVVPAKPDLTLSRAELELSHMPS